MLNNFKALADKKGIDLEQKEIKELVRVVELKSYSINTIKSYKRAFSVFLDYFYPRNMETLLKRENRIIFYGWQKKKSTTQLPYTAL
jgi:hypothetical protein